MKGSFPFKEFSAYSKYCGSYEARCFLAARKKIAGDRTKMLENSFHSVETLLGTDWRQAWIEREKRRRWPDALEVWDERAKDFAQNVGSSSYARSFLDYLAPEPGSSILDMGCGCGTLAIPLARQGHMVLAADFSGGMLSALKDAIDKESLTSIRCAQLDFNAPWSEWEAAGITNDCVDIAIASRSAMVTDLWAALEKLERAASQRVAITLATEYSPREAKRMGEIVDGSPFIPDYVFAVNVLIQMGRYPSLRYIDSDKVDENGTLRHIRWAYISWGAKSG